VTAEVLAVIKQGVSLLVGTCDAVRTPHSTRATGLHIHEDGSRATVYLPEVTSRHTVSDVAVNPRVALLVSQPLSLTSFQLKGAVLSVGLAPEAARPLVEEYLSSFAHVLEAVGMPFEVVTMLSHWPSIALELSIDELYVQTPGPGAGSPLPQAVKKK
jgi:hypothetical protein